MHLSALGIITDEQVETPMCLLVASQHQALGQGVTPSAVGLHGNRFDIEKYEMPTGGQMSEKPADPSQNCRSLRVWTEKLALHPSKVKIVFLATDASVPVRLISQYVA